MSRIASAAFKGLGELVSPAVNAVKAAPAAVKAVPGFGALNTARKLAGLETSAHALPWLLPSIGMVGELGVKPIYKAIHDKNPMDAAIDEEMQRRRYQVSQQLKAQRLQAAMADNMMRLAAANPQLYNQLLVGRTLPQGAVVIGGGQKSDFLESVAYQMATGGFGNPQGSPDSPDVMQTLVNSY